MPAQVQAAAILAKIMMTMSKPAAARSARAPRQMTGSRRNDPRRIERDDGKSEEALNSAFPQRQLMKKA